MRIRSLRAVALGLAWLSVLAAFSYWVASITDEGIVLVFFVAIPLAFPGALLAIWGAGRA